MHLSRLDNEVFFKKAFTDKLVFTQFVKDVIGIDIKVGKIETEKRFKPKVAYIDFAYDIFAESKDNRVIIEIQRVKYDYNFDRFLHYHIMGIAQLQKSANDYKIKPTVYTIVVLTASDTVEDKKGEIIQEDILISDINPHNLKGKVFNLYGHQLIFLNPNFKNDNTPPRVKDWLDLILESIDNPDNPKINLKNKAIKKAAKLIDDDNLTPEERRAAKIAFATEETRKIVERNAKAEGQKEGRMEEKLETAQKMIAKGFDIESISEMTELDAETIKQLETGEYYNNTD
ncbi:PD-(D/E)XK nuclease family transposase [Candidatus Parabeggiatoa sp. HSG14]|uniref:PD-(D/E)XK nuclease family transposase n=1 Tax=Candidatus Parabeggiatoa sp. HSG14 TaxID=3055593 RepID=UPI0025A82BE8|nr:PD-(D/E)XK nuclease family transposase [Thiotrichales bacterium HSG14]